MSVIHGRPLRAVTRARRSCDEMACKGEDYSEFLICQEVDGEQ